MICFNTQPPEGGWVGTWRNIDFQMVSTRSRPKAAGCRYPSAKQAVFAFQHAAARRRLVLQTRCRFGQDMVSTRSRPKAAGFSGMPISSFTHCFNTQPPEGGWARLELALLKAFVSTRSRPKAAGWKNWIKTRGNECFNTQPPEGGWTPSLNPCAQPPKFQHAAARRRLA